jgi:hypothetical protein
MCDQILARLQEFPGCHFGIGRALKAASEFLRNVEARRRQQFGERAVGADKMEKKALSFPPSPLKPCASLKPSASRRVGIRELTTD